MQLKLTRPLLFFDIESTGLNVATDRIVEISMVKLMPDGSRHVKTRRINPTIPIPKEAQAVHGISDEDVKDEPTFAQLSKSILQWMEGCDIAGYNSINYDIPLLTEEFMRVGLDPKFRERNLVDVQVVFYKKEPRTLSAAYKFYCNKNLEDAHSAEADTMATLEVLEAQLDHYDDLPNDVAELSKYTRREKMLDYAGRIILNDHDVPVFNFGKHKGKPVAQVLADEPSYLSWMQNGDFTQDTKAVLSKIALESKNEHSHR
ncbi:MAG: 3'-5' exonuclease [Bacteroidales bacterium]|nr:3'-5' exonuclease [Bacteroidales bacterium]